MDKAQFSYGKRGIFRRVKEIKGLRGGVHWYAAQVSSKIDAAMAEKNRFRMKTSLVPVAHRTSHVAICFFFFEGMSLVVELFTPPYPDL